MVHINSKLIAILVGLLFAAPYQALAQVEIFACEPEWASLSKEIGGEQVKLTTATTAFTDPHHIRAKPSLIAAIRRADLVICSGAGLEVGWLPILLERGKANIQPGQIGLLYTSDYVQMLETHSHVDRSMGDVHPEGNPHIHLNPGNIPPIANEIYKRLSTIDSDNAAYYQNQYVHFTKKWQAALTRWQQQVLPLKNMPLVVHHKSWAYLIDWIGLKQQATLEPKPGIPPSTAHLAELMTQLQGKDVKVIVHAPYEDPSAAQWLSDKIGAPVVVLPFTVGGSEDTKDLFSLFKNTIQLLSAHNQ